MTSEVPSASYSAIMNNGGELLLGVGDMDIHDHITPDYVRLCKLRFPNSYLTFLAFHIYERSQKAIGGRFSINDSHCC